MTHSVQYVIADSRLNIYTADLVHAHVSLQSGKVEIVLVQQCLQRGQALAELGEHQHLRYGRSM